MKTQLNTDKPVHLDVALKPGAWVDPSLFIKQIGDAGYEARRDDVRLTLTGKLDKEGDRLVLTLDDVKPGPQTFVVVQGQSKKEKQAMDFADAFQAAQDRAGKTVELEGYWRPADKKKDKTALPTLTVVRVVELQPKPEPGKPTP